MVYEQKDGKNRAHPDCHLPPVENETFFTFLELSVKEYLPQDGDTEDRSFGHTQKILDVTLEDSSLEFKKEDYPEAYIQYLEFIGPSVSSLMGGIGFRGELFSLLFKFYLIPKRSQESDLVNRVYLVTTN